MYEVASRKLRKEIGLGRKVARTYDRRYSLQV